MSDIFNLSTDQTILGLDGNAVANGQVHFYDRTTGDYAPVYGDAGLGVTLRQPVQADSGGVLPSIYLDDAIAYRAAITDRKNNPIREIGDVRRRRDGIKVLDGIDALKRFCGNDPFVLVTTKGGCPVFYKRLSGCELPAERLPDVVRADCCDCCTAWQLCRNEPDICAMEIAELNCDYHVLVQECPPAVRPGDPANPGDPADPCRCADGSEAAAAPAVKKASIGALLSAGARCLPRVCIRHDAPEVALDPRGGLVYGDREPPPIESSMMNGLFAACIRVFIATDANNVPRHVQLDKGITDLGNNPARAPTITLSNPGPCRRRYEIRALNRLHRAKEQQIGNAVGVPILNANLQTRLGRSTDPRLDDILGVADVYNQLFWLTELSIAETTMGQFMTGLAGASDTEFANMTGVNGYTENDLIVDLNPGDTVTYAVKYHIYWDANATPAQLKVAERLHFGTRIIARQVR
ncbi:MAG TPA: hypothetical protein VGO55_17740 [Allosphingosinicella sp.]|jgi:hypothetical protein|nr:hypothetical protein [Allosphingosinicella sp.]